MVDPKIQPDLIVHLINLRGFKVVLVGDISKMYRQMLVHPEDCKFQLIVWRRPGTSEIRTYQLNTITYGTASAPYQAVRCVQELAQIERDQFPLAHELINNHFYVDDMLTGASTVNEALEKYHQVRTVLSHGKMK